MAEMKTNNNGEGISTNPGIHDTQNIVYGSVVRIQHMNTKHHLHSHGIKYVNGTKKQEITGFGGKDSNDLFVIKPGVGVQKKFGTPIYNGNIITIQHLNTFKFVHSQANVKSPVSGQQEVNGCDWGNSNDDWILFLNNIDVKDRKTKWSKGASFKLIHYNTQHSLHSHQQNLKNGSKQQEVTAFKNRDTNDNWCVIDIINNHPLFKGLY